MSNPLVEQRQRAHSEAIAALASGNKASYDKAMSDVDRLGLEIEKSKRGGITPMTRIQLPDNQHLRSFAFAKWLRGGQGAVSNEEMRSIELRDGLTEGSLAAHIGTYAGLGYLVPTGFAGRIENATKYYAPLLEDGVFQVLETSTGNPIPFPISDDTSQSATVVGEQGEISEADIIANHVVISACKLTSGVIRASVELLQDSAIDIEAWLAERFGIRYGRGLEFYLTNGEGSGATPRQPLGLLTAVEASGATPVTAVGAEGNSGLVADTSANSIGYADLVSLEHSVDPSYRRNAKYMFHDTTLAKLKKIVDKYGRPLWAPGIGVDVGDTLNGYPYVINQAFPVIATSATVVAFGDMTKFLVRKVSGYAVQQLRELYAINGEVGYISNMRCDSALLDAGTHPINTLRMSS